MQRGDPALNRCGTTLSGFKAGNPTCRLPDPVQCRPVRFSSSIFFHSRIKWTKLSELSTSGFSPNSSSRITAKSWGGCRLKCSLRYAEKLAAHDPCGGDTPQHTPQ